MFGVHPTQVGGWKKQALAGLSEIFSNGRESAHDMERLLPLFAEDVIYEDVTMGVMNRGAAELRTFAEGVFSRFPEVTFELQSSFADGTRGGAESVMRGTRDLPGMPTTGKRVEADQSAFHKRQTPITLMTTLAHNPTTSGSSALIAPTESRTHSKTP